MRITDELLEIRIKSLKENLDDYEFISVTKGELLEVLEELKERRGIKKEPY